MYQLVYIVITSPFPLLISSPGIVNEGIEISLIFFDPINLEALEICLEDG